MSDPVLDSLTAEEKDWIATRVEKEYRNREAKVLRMSPKPGQDPVAFRRAFQRESVKRDFAGRVARKVAAWQNDEARRSQRDWERSRRP